MCRYGSKDLFLTEVLSSSVCTLHLFVGCMQKCGDGGGTTIHLRRLYSSSPIGRQLLSHDIAFTGSHGQDW